MLCNATFKEYCSLQKHYLPMYRNAKESVNPSPETKRSSLTQEENSVEWRKNGWMLFPEFCFLIQGYIQRCISQGFLMPDVSFLDQWSMIATWVLIDLPLSVRFLMFSFPPFLPCIRFWRRKKTFLYFIMDLPLSVSEKCPHEIAVWLDLAISTGRSMSFNCNIGQPLSFPLSSPMSKMVTKLFENLPMEA